MFDSMPIFVNQNKKVDTLAAATIMPCKLIFKELNCAREESGGKKQWRQENMLNHWFHACGDQG